MGIGLSFLLLYSLFDLSQQKSPSHLALTFEVWFFEGSSCKGVTVYHSQTNNNLITEHSVHIFSKYVQADLC